MNEYPKVARDTLMAIATTAGLIFITSFIFPFVGALIGFILSVVMPSWITGGLGYVGIRIDSSELYKLGAALGFISGFFRIRMTDKAK